MDKINIKSICAILLGIVLLFFGFIAAEIIHYDLESRHRVRVIYTVIGDRASRRYQGTYNIVGDDFEVLNYWRHHKYSRGHRVVMIVDKHAWYSYIADQSVCIYTGLSDVEVNSIKMIE